MKDIELSNHTKPGKLGFNYGIELRLVGKNWDSIWYGIRNLSESLEKTRGKKFQKHWNRKQPNRKWYVYYLDRGDTYRFCFKTERERMMARLMYNEKNT